MGVMVALEGAFVNFVDGIVVQFQRTQAAQKVKTIFADRAQVIVAQVELSQ